MATRKRRRGKTEESAVSDSKRSKSGARQRTGSKARYEAPVHPQAASVGSVLPFRLRGSQDIQDIQVDALAATPDLGVVVSGGSDGVISVWDTALSLNGAMPLLEKERKLRPSPPPSLTGMAIRVGYLPVAGTDPIPSAASAHSATPPLETPPLNRRAPTYDAELALYSAAAAASAPAVSALAVSPSADFLVVGSSSGALSVLSLRYAPGSLLAELAIPALLPGMSAGHAVGAHLATDGATCAAALSGGVAAVWDLESAAPAHVLDMAAESSSFTGLAVLPESAPGGRRLALSTLAGPTLLWDPRTPAKEAISLKSPGSTQWALCVAASPDGSHVYVGHNESQGRATVRVYDVAAGASAPPVVSAFTSPRTGPVLCLAVPPTPASPTTEPCVLAGTRTGMHLYSVALESSLEAGARFRGVVAGPSAPVAAIVTAPGVPCLVSSSGNRGFTNAPVDNDVYFYTTQRPQT